RPDCIVTLIALRQYQLGSELQRVLADRLPNVIADAVGWIGMAPGHVGGIGRETSPSVSCVGAKERDSRHLSAETVVEQISHAALRDPTRWINAKLRIALAGSGGIANQRLIQRGIALKLRAARSVLVDQGNT